MLIGSSLASDLVDFTVNLGTRRITAGQAGFSFYIDPVGRTKLLHGWDDFDFMTSHAEAIEAFAAETVKRDLGQDLPARPKAAR